MHCLHYMLVIFSVRVDLRCEDLRDIPHGRVEIIPFNQFGAVAKYICDDGYTLFGVPGRVCQGDETWSKEEPRCGPTKVIDGKLQTAASAIREYIASAPRAIT